MTGANDQLIISAAAPSGGVVLRQTLLDRGLTSRAISTRLHNGQLRRVRRGLYVVPALESEWTPLFVAQLRVPRAVLSRQTAARLHGMHVGSTGSDHLVHVTAPAHAGRRVPGVVVHESRRLEEDDIATVNGLRLTSTARTLVDLGAELRPARLRNLMQSQFAVGQPSTGEFIACFSSLRRRGLTGVRTLSDAFEATAGNSAVGVSELEARVWLGLHHRGIDGFTAQFVPPWFDGVRGVVDFAHLESRTILECDGRAWHQARSAMEDDRRRDRVAAANGYLVLRVMWDEVVHRPTATFTEIAETIERRRTQPAA